MNEYLNILLLSSGVFLLGNLFPFLGAFCLARRFAGDSVPGKIALTLFLYFVQCIAAFAIPGALGCLAPARGCIAAAASGLLLSAAAKFLPGGKKPECTPQAGLCRTETYLTLTIVFFFLMNANRTSILPGTDTYLYHLYYPAMWLLHGKIFPVSITGLSNEYFPVPGETLYGWLMLSGTDTPFLPLLQLASLLMGVCAAAHLWKIYRVPSLFIQAGILLTVMTGIIMENAVLCYTDVLTGAFLAAGVSFLIPVLDGKYSRRTDRIFFSLAAGIALGLAAAMKYSGLVLAPPIALMLLVRFLFRRRENSGVCLLTAVTAVISAGCWYLPNLIRTGNPFYPVKIPFLFSRGVDFERAPVPIGDLWNALVSDNPWDMNAVSAAVYLLLAVCALLLLFRRKERELSQLTGMLAAVFLVSGVIMLLVFPSTQARQAVPFLSVLAILFAPVLYLYAGRLSEKRSLRIGGGIFVLLLGHLTSRNIFPLGFAVFILCVSVVLLFLSLPTGRKWHRGVLCGLLLLGLASLFYYCNIRWSAALNNFEKFAGSTAVQCTAELRKNFRPDSPFRIASVGSWYNYMLMMDMPGNEVCYVPVNRKNTTHPHELDSIEELRDDPVPYEVWLDRVRSGGFTHLIIDLAAHQDFPRNKEVELKWALAHPEDFEPVCSDKQIYFFRVRR